MSLVLVTGVSGYLGAHVAEQLLIAGYRVRGTARSGKIALVKEGYAGQDKFEVVEVNDIVHGDFTEALKDVEHVIHTASPLFKGTPEEEITIAEQGTLNVLRQAEKAGVKRFVVTSSISTSLNPKGQWTPETWSPIPKEAALGGHLDWFSVYIVSKTVAEQAVWKFADEHPNIDITTINPHFFFGKFAPGFRIKKGDYSALSTNEWIYKLLKPDGEFPQHGGCTDITDAARAHVLALSAPPTSEVGRKRILMSTEWFLWKDVMELLAKERPELKDRLADGSKAKPGPCVGDIVDHSRCKSVLGLEERDWRPSVLEAVDAVIELEKKWAAES